MTAHDVYYEGSPYYAALHDRYGVIVPGMVAVAICVDHGTSLDELGMNSSPIDTLDLVMGLGY